MVGLDQEIAKQRRELAEIEMKRAALAKKSRQIETLAGLRIRKERELKALKKTRLPTVQQKIRQRKAKKRLDELKRFEQAAVKEGKAIAKALSPLVMAGAKEIEKFLFPAQKRRRRVR